MNIRHDVSTGTVWGRLTVTGKAPAPKGQSRVYCVCECGSRVELPRGALTQGSTRSCGCLRREVTTARSTSHGATDSAEHRVWTSLRERCRNPRCKAWESYGGRGITVCAAWDDFAVFLADAGPRPAGRDGKLPAYTIDRINNDAGYWCGKCPECVSLGHPSNCRWATKVQQIRNRRTTFSLYRKGETKTAMEWSIELGIPYDRIKWRKLHGWTDAEALK